MHDMALHDTIEPAAAISRTIRRRVRATRTELGWTLDQLATRSGVSRRMLINVEQGVTNPSIATLLRLSDALGIGLPALVDTADDGAESVVVHRDGELWDWRLGPGDDYRSEAHRAGTRELMHVLTGTVLLVVDGTEHKLKAGDSASFDGGLAHAYRNASATRPARFSLAVYEPGLTRENP